MIPGWSRRSRTRTTPTAVTFAADPGTFAALRGQDIRMAVVVVAPPQTRLQLPIQQRVAGEIGVGHGEGPQRTELCLDRIRPRGVGRGQTQLHLVASGPRPNRGGGVGREVVADDV